MLPSSIYLVVLHESNLQLLAEISHFITFNDSYIILNYLEVTYVPFSVFSIFDA